MYLDQQMHASACLHMVENNEKRLVKSMFLSCLQEAHVQKWNLHEIAGEQPAFGCQQMETKWTRKICRKGKPV